MELSNNFVDINMIKKPALQGTTESSLKNKNDKELKEVCNKFEAFFMNQILEVSLKSTNVAGEATGSKIIQGMYTDALSTTSAGTLGISDMLYKFLDEKRK